MKNGGGVTQNEENKESLSYEGVLVWDLVKKDTDLDGIPDWEERLYGTDINKKDTNDDGVPDSQEIEQRRILEDGDDKNLTETEKFSREFFATAAALSQTGAMDDEAVEKLNTSLLEKIQSPEVRKTYLLSDLKTTEDTSLKTFTTYNSALISIFIKYQAKESVAEILEEFIGDGESENVAALARLDPIIKQTNTIISGMLAVKTPQALAQEHLDIVNALEKLSENLSDIKLYDTDPILSMGGISAYEENSASLESAIIKLGDELNKKLKN